MMLRRPFNGISKLRHFLQVLAFTLVVATIQYAFMPDKPYGPPVVYSTGSLSLPRGVLYGTGEAQVRTLSLLSSLKAVNSRVLLSLIFQSAFTR